ncbi:conserved protein of unknown function [Georgfuchsia toluolica]|uniref:SIR2-like domain-containing protein n=1 Tax=Georgfuchsia toluolica TaxID=424218 RepID=A0A916N0F2_9PROT|nr:hypothetical protein [Georgfuchsia toluolica]CAG4883868.1 conserved protein of unknown function [Georgfuchsia toluolica]
MIKSKTVFIVGAGASAEVKLPVGEQLKKIISDKLNIKFDDFGSKIRSGDTQIASFMRQEFGQSLNRYLHACWKISDGVGLAGSIDDFIDTHQDDPDVATCGKIAIARSILEAEKSSHLFFKMENISDTINFGSLQKTWYMPFIELLTQGVSRTEVKTVFNNVAVICFNYDRCIEHFMLHALMARYSIEKQEAAEVVTGLKIIHPYGIVGQYFDKPGEMTVPFGSSAIPHLHSTLSNLRTYTEEVTDTDSLNAMKNAVAESEISVFLGTAFHPNNMRIMSDGLGQPVVKRVYATTAGISDENKSMIKDDIGVLFRGAKHVGINFATTCSDLFSRYSMHLRR